MSHHSYVSLLHYLLNIVSHNTSFTLLLFFSDINISQGSVATRLRCDGDVLLSLLEITVKSVDEIILN